MFATLSSPAFLTAWVSGTATGLGLFVFGVVLVFVLIGRYVGRSR